LFFWRSRAGGVSSEASTAAGEHHECRSGSEIPMQRGEGTLGGELPTGRHRRQRAFVQERHYCQPSATSHVVSGEFGRTVLGFGWHAFRESPNVARLCRGG